MIFRSLLFLIAATALQAQDIDALLAKVKRETAQRQTQLSARETAFLDAKKTQQKALRAARAELAALKGETTALQGRFDANEAKLAEQEGKLKNRMGDLGEIIGIVNQNASDLEGVLRTSPVSAHMTGRDALIHALAGSRKLPVPDDLEKLWLTMLEEMVESGKVTTFKAAVVQPDGSQSDTQVTRIGPFSLIAQGKYLRFDSDKQQLIELPRQPQSRYRQLAEEVEAGSGIVTAAIDPTRGTIFELMMEQPTLQERIAQGGFIGYVILGIAALGLLIALVRLVLLSLERFRISRQLAAPEQPSDGNALGRILKIYDAGRREPIPVLESKLDEAILKELPRVTSGEALIKMLAAVAPLLGLLGTVVGMIETFQAITLFGSGDPKLMAGGISQALVTTMLGLTAAVPLLFAHALLRSRSRVIIEILSQQSAGLIARQMEAHHGRAA